MWLNAMLDRWRATPAPSWPRTREKDGPNERQALHNHVLKRLRPIKAHQQAVHAWWEEGRWRGNVDPDQEVQAFPSEDAWRMAIEALCRVHDQPLDAWRKPGPFWCGEAGRCVTKVLWRDVLVVPESLQWWGRLGIDPAVWDQSLPFVFGPSLSWSEIVVQEKGAPLLVQLALADRWEVIAGLMNEGWSPHPTATTTLGEPDGTPWQASAWDIATLVASVPALNPAQRRSAHRGTTHRVAEGAWALLSAGAVTDRACRALVQEAEGDDDVSPRWRLRESSDQPSPSGNDVWRDWVLRPAAYNAHRPSDGSLTAFDPTPIQKIWRSHIERLDLIDWASQTNVSTMSPSASPRRSRL